MFDLLFDRHGYMDAAGLGAAIAAHRCHAAGSRHDWNYYTYNIGNLLWIVSTIDYDS
jgi:hypothetical protein